MRLRPCHVAIFGLAALLLCGTTAGAGSVSVDSRTLATAGGLRPEFGAADARSQVILLELLRVSTLDVGVTGLQAEVSGLAGAHVADPPLVDPATEGDRFVGNLLVGLLRWSSRRNTMSVTLGRQYLFAGAGRAEHLDGLTLGYRTPWNVDLTLFGGRSSPWQLDPTVTDPADERWYLSNWAAGGRLRFRLLEHSLAAVGFIHEGYDTQVVRQSLTFDVGTWRYRVIEALAGGSVDTVEGLPQELWVQLISRPSSMLKLTADYTYQVPALLIPRTSIFSVFAPTTSYHDAGLGAHVGLREWLTCGVEGGLRLFPEEEGSLRLGYTAAASAQVGFASQRLLGLRVELLDVVEERQLTTRLFGLYRFRLGLHASVDLHLLYFDLKQDAGASIFARAREDNPLSLGGLGAVGYRFTPSLSAQLAGSAFVTPTARHDLRLVARLTYEASWGRP